MQSHPVWVRGLKRDGEVYLCFHITSHPVWVRGLKPFNTEQAANLAESHPVWVRGLKPEEVVSQFTEKLVAPRVGAWIETC